MEVEGPAYIFLWLPAQPSDPLKLPWRCSVFIDFPSLSQPSTALSFELLNERPEIASTSYVSLNRDYYGSFVFVFAMQ